MVMSPFVPPLLGMDVPHAPRHGDEAACTAGDAHVVRTARPARRPASHYNSFQTVCSPSDDDPPAYAVAARCRPPASRPGGATRPGAEPLPEYSCAINAEAKVLYQLESVNPLHGICLGEWREVYMVLCGTQLSLYRVKDGGRGKLLRAYTLQHAEVGLAIDTQHIVLIPQTRLASLIPGPARRRAWQKDPSLFRVVRQHILRLRVETDQILLADPCEDVIRELIQTISAGIDVAPAIDERSFPKQFTVPRRRRRAARTRASGDFHDPEVLAEQERILRDMYPTFAQHHPALRAAAPLDRDDAGAHAPHTPTREATREEDEVDLAAMRDEVVAGHAHALSTSSAAATPHAPAPRHMTDDMMYATSPANFTAAGKWAPPQTWTAAQVQRYARRCLPVLPIDAVRASDILVCHGKRVRINWRMELLEEWELSPPSYKAHGFTDAAAAALERSKSTSSQTASSADTARRESASVDGAAAAADDDHIERAESRLSALGLVKSPHHKGPRPQDRAPRPAAPSGKDARHPDHQVHGVVFCF